MKRENYKRHVLLARADKVREQPIWRARVAIDRFIDGNWQEVPIRSQLDGMEFTNGEDALTAALEKGRQHVDGLPQSRH
jgi:hypothetical protein